MTWEGLTPPYSTIVADPPWDHSDGTGVRFGRGDSRYGNWVEGEDAGITTVPYSVMTVEDVAALPVVDIAAVDAHLYLWTTNRYLRDSYEVAEAWGFKVASTLVWCKEPFGFNVGGTFGSTVEFVHFCRRGSLAATGSSPTRWFRWPRKMASPVRRGEKRSAGHSNKPPAFLDLVEQVSPGPYVELFCRSPRLGWDHWGKGYEVAA